MRLRRALILICVAWLLGLVCYAYSQMIEFRTNKPWLVDFSLIYLSAKAFGDGGGIYAPRLARPPEPETMAKQDTQDHPHPNLNMPIVNVILWPLSLLGTKAAIAVWISLSVVFVIAAAGLLGRNLVMESGGSPFYQWLVSGLLAILLLIYYPTWASANLGQMAQLLLLLLSGAWLAARRRHDRLAGVLFGLALTLKPFTGIFLLILPWLRRWRLLSWYLGSFLVLALLGAIFVGPNSYPEYFSVLREVNWYGQGWNASLMAPLSILLGGGLLPGWFDHPWLAKLISIACSSVFYAALVSQIRTQQNPTTKLDLTIAGGIPLMLLASPLGWLYYFPAVWIAALAVVEAVRPLPSRWGWWLAAAFIIIVCGLPFPFVSVADASQSLRSLLNTSGDTLALLVAFGITLATARRMARHSREAAAPVPSLKRNTQPLSERDLEPA